MPYCFRHQDEDALYECAYCGKAICGECMRFMEDDDDTVICPECTREAILESTHEDAIDDELDKEMIRQSLLGLSKMRVQEVMNTWLLFIFIIVVAIYGGSLYYLSRSQEPVTAEHMLVQKAGHPILEMSLFMAGIFNYAADHEGRFPEKLKDIIPDYIDKEWINVLSTKNEYSYAADSKNGFALNCPIADRFGFQKLYVTKEGIIHIE